MTDRSSVIFGNKMPDKVYKKAVKSKKKYMKKFGDDSRKNYEVAVEKNRYIEIPWEFTIFWWEIWQRMHIMMSMRMRKKVHLHRKRDHCRKYPYGIWTLPHFHGDGVCGEGDGLYVLLDGLKFLWGDDLHKSDRCTE